MWLIYTRSLTAIILNENYLQELLKKVAEGTATEEEQEQLQLWYTSFDDSEAMVPVSSKQDDYSQIKKNLVQRIRNTLGMEENPSSYRFTSWRIAASLIFLIGSAGAFMLWNASIKDKPLVYQTWYSPLGQNRILTLSDGTTVHLNAGTTLKAPVKFSGHIRPVFLEGEAFFEVAKNTEKPFIITTGKLKTTVVGTSFNVKAYAPAESVEVAVITGAVKVGDSISSVQLVPHQKAVYHRNGSLQKQSFTDEAIYKAWTTGELVFDHQSMQEIVAVLNRHYNVEIHIQNEALKHCILTARFDNTSLEKVIHHLSTYFEAKHQRTKDVITLIGDFAIDDKEKKLNITARKKTIHFL